MELDSSMQLFRGLVPPPTLTAHPKKISLLVNQGVDVEMPIHYVVP